MTFATTGRTDVGRKRDHNEDAVLATALDDAHLLAVADGMGGHEAGDVASATALDAFEAALDGARPFGDPTEALREAAHAAADAVSRAATDVAGTMGTTLVGALIVPDRDATVVNVGDSRAYHVTDGRTEQVTDDHSLVRNLVEEGVIPPDEAADHPQRHVVTQALGTDGDVDPDAYSVTPTGTLLLCSDGLTEEVADERIGSIVRAAPDVETAAEELVREANANGGSDNVSVALAAREGN